MNIAEWFYGKGYSAFGTLGNMEKVYCTELVWYAYMVGAGINLGNGMSWGSWGILFPRDMYCDSDIKPYYVQKAYGMC